MVKLTRFDGSQIVANSDLIEFLEATPDTVVTLLTGEKIVVQESVDAIVEQVVAFRRRAAHRHFQSSLFRVTAKPGAGAGVGAPPRPLDKDGGQGA
jgi:flagellar protein FlbD